MDEAFPTLTLKERQRRQREELILRSTEEVLVEKGYHEMSMDEIAARVGIAKGTLYLHFAKKEDLVLALLEREIDRLYQIQTQAEAQEGSVRSKLEFLVQTLYRQFAEQHDKLLYAIFSSDDIRYLMKEKHDRLLGSVLENIKQLLAQGQERGEFDPTIPTEVMLDAFTGIVFARIRRQRMPGQLKKTLSSLETTREATVILMRIFFRGVGAIETESESTKK